METTQARRGMNPLLVAASIAIIIFCATGVAALLGWIPMSGAGSSASEPEASGARADKQARMAQGKVPAQSGAQPAPRPGAQAQSGAKQPARSSAAACRDCGVIESVREMEKPGDASGLGAVAGGVVGGVVGNQVGGGRGKDLATIAGAVGGAVVGHQIEKQVKKSSEFQTTVRFGDGTTRVLTQSEAPAWRKGDRVKVVGSQVQML